MTIKRKVKRTTKRKVQRKVKRKVASPRPENPAEALAWLHALAEHVRAILHEPPAPFADARYVQQFADTRYLRWFANAEEIYSSEEDEKNPEVGEKDLEKILGLKAGLGRPADRERRAGILEKLLKIALLRSEGRQWKEIGRTCGMSPQAARKLHERESSNLDEARVLARAKESGALAKKIVARLEAKTPVIAGQRARWPAKSRK